MVSDIADSGFERQDPLDSSDSDISPEECSSEEEVDYDFNFANCFNEFKKKREKKANEDTQSVATKSDELFLISKVKAKMIKYQALEMIKNDGDALQWWAVNHETFLNLALLVKKYLSAPPFSVASERLFSIGCINNMPKHNCIGPDTGEMLMLLHHNLPILGIDFS